MQKLSRGSRFAAVRAATLFLLLVCLPGLLPAADAAAAPATAPLRIAAVNEPPMAWAGTRQAEGLGPAFARALLVRTGDRAEIDILPETRALQLAQREPNVILLGFSRTAERESVYHWIAPMIRKPWVLYVHADEKRQVETLTDLMRFSAIAVVQGDVREQWLRSQGIRNLVDSSAPEQAVKLLQINRVDAFFHEPQSVQWYCRAGSCGRDAPKAAWIARYSDVWILMSKSGTDLALVQRWQKAAQQMRSDGSWERLARDWSERGLRENGISSVWRDGLLEYCADSRSCQRTR